MKNRFNEMRYLLFVLLLILPVFAGAQTRVYVTQDQPQQIRQFRGGVDALNYFRLPIQGGHSIPAGDSLWFVRVNPADSNVYMWDGLTWKCVSCGSGSGADSSVFATNYRLDTTRSGLDARVSAKLDISDTTGKWLALGWLSSLVKYSDTSGMLQPYLRSVVFADSLNAIHGAINDTAQAIRSDIPDVSGLATQQGLNDTAAVLRDSIDSLRVAIPDISGLIPYSDTNAVIATTYGVDTAKQNIRDEINNLPAPPVTSVNGQTGDVVLQFMDTAYVSGDTIYAEKGGNPFVVGVMTGDTTGIWPAIMERVLYTDTVGVIATKTNISNMWVNGGNSFLPSPGNDFIGTNNNNNLNIETNNVTRIQLLNNGSININQGTSGNAGISVNPNGNTSIGKITNSGDKLEVSGASTYDGTSASAGYISRWRNSSGTVVAQFNNNNTVQFNSISGTGTGVVIGTSTGVITIERPPASGTYTLKSIDGVIQWVED